MKKITLFFVIVGGIFWLAAVNPVTEDGIGWRGNNRDGKVTGFEKPATWPGMLKQVWKIPVGLGDASPVLTNGRIYLQTKKDADEVVLCLNAQTGETLWESMNNPAPEVTGGAASHPGPRSTPYVTANQVITIGAGGFVTCRNPMNGELLWKTDAYTSEVPQFFVSVSPLLAGGKFIAHLYGKEKGTVVAFDPETGKENWKLEGEPSTYSSPVMMETFPDMVAVQGETDLLGISTETGALLWKTPTPGETRFYNSSTPVIHGDQVIIAGQGSGARSLQIARGDTAWSVTETWKNPEIAVSFNTPVLKDGFLYGNDARFGYLFCQNAGTGATCWVDSVKNNRFASVLDLGEVMVSLPATGQLIVFNADPAAYQEIVRYKVAETEVYAHPVFSGSRFFVKDKEHLTCWSF